MFIYMTFFASKHFISDCSCDVKCKQGFVRDPADDFKCKANDSSTLINAKEKPVINIDDKFQIVNLTVSRHFSKLSVSWCVDMELGTSLKHIEVT